jgi:hypothetical protein
LLLRQAESMLTNARRHHAHHHFRHGLSGNCKPKRPLLSNVA